MCEHCNSFGYVFSILDGTKPQIQHCHECDKHETDVEAHHGFVTDLEMANPHAWHIISLIQLETHAPDYATLMYKIRDGVRCNGSFDYKLAISGNHIEESMNQWEIDTAKEFLQWIVANDRTFGHNLPTVFGEWMALKE